ncbi:SDR family oxidoreductase [Geobacter pelophilus]|uniref:SDR family oxidoreductase n=1 Tax=Geoanaerobacter pelophilus TaxID=60036 RepID=A0AAW4L349_9BACT|nr:SDR family oxidoreductase [Geoanaerobacter pelophilus]MBT0663920.1 SDR family oxidoreductase [Geoanaerobacter pelophilus]
MAFPDIFSLDKKTAVITGAGGDIGAAIARAMLAAGANLVLTSLSVERLADTYASLGSGCDSRVLIAPADVTDPAQVDGVIASAVAKFGSIDILVTAAGIQLRKPALDFSLAEWEQILRVNLTGTFLCCQAAGKVMLPRGEGKIITISSLTAEIGIPNIAPYAASRGAIKQLTKSLAVEWAKSGINVNCIGPGRIRTKMTDDIFKDDAIRTSFLRLIPAGYAATPDDISWIAVFLASSAAKYIHGQTIYADGGWLAAGGSSLG